MIGLITRIKDRLAGKAPGGARRSSQWPKARAAHLALWPSCALCGGETALEVHHVVPFHRDASKELDPTNLITLCESGRGGVNCHLFAGHLGNYKSDNPTVVDDAGQWRLKVARAGLEGSIDYYNEGNDDAAPGDRGNDSAQGADGEKGVAETLAPTADPKVI